LERKHSAYIPELKIPVFGGKITFLLERNILVFHRLWASLFLPAFLFLFCSVFPSETVADALRIGFIGEVVMVPDEPVSPASSFLSRGSPEACAIRFGSLKIRGPWKVRHDLIILILRVNL
jgi:hypothetical protein